MCAKASKTLRHLHRNIVHTNPSLRKTAYQTFICTQREFASAVWSPHQKYLITKLESILNRAARFMSSKTDISCYLTSARTGSTAIKSPPLCFPNTFMFCQQLPIQIPTRTSRGLHHSLCIRRTFGKTECFNCLLYLAPLHYGIIFVNN